MTINLVDDPNAVIYTRKSSVSDGRATSDQEHFCREWCGNQGIPVERVICDEGISASRYGTKARTGWDELKTILRPGHILVVWEASRATRDLEEFVALRNLCAEHKVLFAYNGRVLDLTSGDDRFVGGLDILLAERESEMLRERFMRGKAGARMRGTQNAALGWGYRAKPREVGQKRTEWEVDPYEAARIQESVRRVIAGESLLSVLRYLRSTEGYVPGSHANLRRALARPALSGMLVYKGEIVGKGTWNAIITEEDRQRVISASKYNRAHPGPEPKHFCSGIVSCEACGGPLRFHNHANRCPVYRCNKGCGSRTVKVLEVAVEEAILRRLKNINPNDYSSDNPEISEAFRQIEALEDDLKQWQAKAIAGEVQADVYAAVEKDRKQKMEQLRPRVIPVTRKLLTYQTWADGSIAEKRETVRAFLTISIPPVKHLGRRARKSDINIKLI